MDQRSNAAHGTQAAEDVRLGRTVDDEAARVTRRGFLQTSAALAGGASLPLLPALADAQATPTSTPQPGSDASVPNDVAAAARPVTFELNGRSVTVEVEPRVTLLDALRERIALTGTKKGCDRGQCGACTVLVDGRRINSCLTLAVMHDGARITTIEGLAVGERLSPLQAAFIEHDAFQCGFCTPGQLCSATAVLNELREQRVSAVTPDPRVTRVAISDDEIRERMSGNLCRCGAYPNIVAAIRDVVNGTVASLPRVPVER